MGKKNYEYCVTVNTYLLALLNNFLKFLCKLKLSNRNHVDMYTNHVKRTKKLIIGNLLIGLMSNL